MAEGSERSWWRRTRLLAVIVMTTGGVAALLAMFSATLDFGRAPGAPLGAFMATLGVPVLVVLLIFWAAERQGRLDRAHGFYED